MISTDPSIQVTDSGTYTFRVTLASGCVLEETIDIPFVTIDTPDPF